MSNDDNVTDCKSFFFKSILILITNNKQNRKGLRKKENCAYILNFYFYREKETWLDD